jgi:hypothetical protein
MNIFLLILTIVYVFKIIEKLYYLGANSYPQTRVIPASEAVWSMIISCLMLSYVLLITFGVIK